MATTGEQRILVATDLSDGADEAVRQAHARAVADNAKLAVIHVVPNMLRGHPLFPHLGVQNVLAMPANRNEVAAMITQRVVELTSREPDGFEVIIDEGAPHAVVLQHAETWKADLIVVGSRGATGLTAIFLGSVAERVIRHAHTPVLLARPSSTSGRVLVGTDFSDPTLPAVAAAITEARRRSGKLTILHAIDIAASASTWSYVSVPFGGTPYPGLNTEAVAELEKAVDRMLADALAATDLETERKVTWGPAGAALVQEAERENAELVVVGTIGRTGLRRLLLGSVAETVVRAAPCSVLVVRLAS